MIVHKPETGNDILKISKRIDGALSVIRDVFGRVYDKYPNIPQKRAEIAVAKSIAEKTGEWPLVMGEVRVPSPSGFEKIRVHLDVVDQKDARARGRVITGIFVPEGQSFQRKNFVFAPVVVLFAVPILHSADDKEMAPRQVVLEVLDHEMSHVRTRLFDPRYKKGAFAIAESPAGEKGTVLAREFVRALLGIYLMEAKKKGDAYIKTPSAFDTVEKKTVYILRRADKDGRLEPVARYYGLTAPQARAVFRLLAPDYPKFFGAKRPLHEYYRTEDEMRSFALNVLHETTYALARSKACGELHELRERGGDTGACIFKVMRATDSYRALQKHLRKYELESVEREVVKALGKTLLSGGTFAKSRRPV